LIKAVIGMSKGKQNIESLPFDRLKNAEVDLAGHALDEKMPNPILDIHAV